MSKKFAYYLNNPIMMQGMKTIKINESQITEISEATKLTEYKFYNNVQRFLSDLLKDPVGAKVPFLLQANGITRNQLLYHLKSRDIIKRFQKISDKDSEGNPKTAKMVVRYSVPKKNFAKKMKKLFIDMAAKNVPEKKESIDEENECFKDQLNLMKGSPLTMGVIGHPKYKQTDEYAEIMNKKIQDKNIDECDGGAAPSGTTNCQSSGAFVQPMFGVHRRKMSTEIEEDTTASSVTQNGDISMGVAVPFGVDKETKDRTPGFSAERQDEVKKVRRNDIGKVVPQKCPSCGGDVGLTIVGEPIFKCEKCGKYFGTLPFKKHFVNENEIRNALLTEENSINRDIDKEATEVFELISSHKYTPNEINHKDGEYTVYEINFQRLFMGCTIDYKIGYYVYNDGKRHKLDCYSIPMSDKCASICINYDWECGFISLGDLHDSIQHELTHVFKGIKSFGKVKNYKPKTRYISSTADYFYRSNNKYMKAIGCVFYMGLNDEQDAYINGLYGKIKENLPKGVSPKEIVTGSPLYDKIIELIEIRDNINEYFSNKEFVEALSNFKTMSEYKNGLTKETFLKKIDYTLGRIKAKYLNMVKAYQKYMTRSGMMVRGDVISILANSFSF